MLKQELDNIKEKLGSKNAEIDAEIDPWLVKWEKSPYSMWLACAFGVALLSIGSVIGFVIGLVVG